jgi:hypothetical protein
LEGSAIADDPKDGWVADVLKFWFEQTEPDQWFEKDPTFDESIRQRFLGLHEILLSRGKKGLLADAETALAAVIVLDQMSRNMFRDTPRAFAADPLALGGGSRHRPRIRRRPSQGSAHVSVSAVRAFRGPPVASSLGRTDGEPR